MNPATTPALHWAFSHRPEQFTDVVRTLLSGLPPSGTPATPDAALQLQYTVLPNFWRGFIRRQLESAAELPYGTLRLKRRPTADHNHYQYQVYFSHKASGEDLALSYQTVQSPTRTLTGTWSSQTRNHAGDLYQGMTLAGRLMDQGEQQAVELCINNTLTFVSATLASGTDIGCHWSLFDCLAELTQSPLPVTLCLLDDLEKLKPACRLSALDETTIDLEKGPLTLRGFVLQGPAEVPSTWWLNEQGRVVIMSNILNTFVVSEVRHV